MLRPCGRTCVCRPNQLCNGKGKRASCFNFTEEFAASFNSWHQWSTNYTQQLLSESTGGPVISGPWAAMGSWAGSCSFDGIREAQATSGAAALGTRHLNSLNSRLTS